MASRSSLSTERTRPAKSPANVYAVKTGRLEFDVMCENTNAVLSFRWPEGKVKCFGHFSGSKRFPFLLHGPVVTSYDSVFFMYS